MALPSPQPRVDHPLGQHRITVPVKTAQSRIMPDHIILEHKGRRPTWHTAAERQTCQTHCRQSLCRNENTLLIAKIGNLGINRDHSVGKLKHVGERIHKPVLPYGHIAARPGLEPSVAVSAKAKCRSPTYGQTDCSPPSPCAA